LRNTSLLRHINALRCLGALHNAKPHSRSDIARQLGMTRATVGNAIRPLLKDGLVVELEEQGEVGGGAGRPGVLISLNPSGAYFIGIDISTAEVNAVLINLAMRVIAKKVVFVGDDYRNILHVVELLSDLPRQLLRDARVSEKLVRGLCISIPGIVDKRGYVVSAPGLEWRDVDLCALLPKRMRTRWPIQVCNDTVALAGAVRAEEGSSDMQDVLLILLAEGIGGAHIRRGRIVEGAHGFAGEIGHMVMGANAKLAPTGTFEILAGYRRFLKFIPAGHGIPEGLIALSRIEKPDRELIKALQEWSEVLSTGLLNLIHILDPQRIVLGGPLAILYPRVEKRVQEALALNLVHGFNVPGITVASFGPDIAAVGAAALVREILFTLPEITHSQHK
jgi:predicted NBD/HSP70 family sugar kinase/biotin operon repressor